MASPQTENGFTKIANELLEEYIRITRFISPYENTMWLAIVRKTYGFKKKQDWITLSQLEGITTIRQAHLSRTKKKLLEKNMITVNQNRIGIQKDYDKWNIPKRVYTQIGIHTQTGITQTGNEHTQMGNSNIPKQVDTKETITKETITKEIISSCHENNFSDVDIKLTQLLIDLIVKNDPKSKAQKMTEKQQQSWLNECRKLRELDQRPPGEIEFVIKWTQQDDFEKSNILSMPKLRKRFGQLFLKAKRDGGYDKFITGGDW